MIAVIILFLIEIVIRRLLVIRIKTSQIKTAGNDRANPSIGRRRSTTLARLHWSAALALPGQL